MSFLTLKNEWSTADTPKNVLYKREVVFFLGLFSFSLTGKYSNCNIKTHRLQPLFNNSVMLYSNGLYFCL